MSEEKRTFARVDMSTKAHIRLDDQVIDGDVENLSVSGAFVTSAKQLKINAEVAVTIENPLTENICDLKAKVARVTDKGMGLQFEKPLFD